MEAISSLHPEYLLVRAVSLSAEFAF